jgi:radical SAM protein with 4Fe4S-binding SPASM domain
MRSLREIQRRRRMWRAHTEGATRLDYAPLEVWIEPTNHCNLRCVKCPHAVGLKRAKGFMDPALFRRVVDEVSQYAFTVSLHMGGESLIHKGLPELISYASGKGLRAVLHTNATLLNEERSRALVGSGLSLISFSIDGEDSETYESVDAGGKFERTLDGVRTFLRMKREARARKPFTVVQMLTPSPQIANPDGRSVLLGLGADYLKIAGFHSWSGAFSRDGKESIPERGFEKLRRDPTEYAPCHNLWYGITVFWDGKVAPCCMDMEGEYPVGNVTERPLLELWNNDRMVALRKALVERRHEEQDLCRDCAYLWGKAPGSAWQDARGIAKQALREKAPGLARALGVRRWGRMDWNM